MSSDRSDSPPNRTRRGSVTSAALSTLFQRSSVSSTGSSGGSNPSAAAMARDRGRRLSVTTLGLSGTGPAPASAPFAGMRRTSLSTNNSDSVDENAIDEDDLPARTAPTSPFARRMSFGAQAMRQVTSPSASGRPDPARRSSGGKNHRASPSASTSRAPRRSTISQASTAPFARAPSDILSSVARPDQSFNWSEQLRSRAESAVSGMRPAFGSGMSSSPPRTGGFTQHERAQSVSDLPAPPQQAAAIRPKQPERPKPDHMQERILKGDFYMD